MNEGWTVSDSHYYMGAGKSMSQLPKGIFKLVVDSEKGTLFLVRIQDAFKLPSKVYDLDTQLIHHVTRYHDETKDDKKTNNLGILLAGVKGSGKTVTAKQLCNTLDLPVILITRAYAGLPSFINDLKQDVLFFVDEYEKVFANPNESMLLTVMDGALDNGFKRIFLLTINELYISDNLLQRPGRIRYFKRYEDLSFETIQMVVKDCLKHAHLYDETIRFISELQTITIDIIKALIDEVNMFNVSPFSFASIFNVKKKEFFVDLYQVHEDNSRTIAREFLQKFVPMEGKEVATDEGYHIITEVLDSNMFKARRDKHEKTFVVERRDALHVSFKKQKI